MPDDFTALSRAAANSSFRSVEKPIGRERLMCTGSGTPRSLVKKEWMTGPVSDMPPFKIEINFVNDAYSIVDGYPRQSQQRPTYIKKYGSKSGHTLDIEMSRPISFNVGCCSLPPTMQARIISRTNSGRRGVQVVKLRR